MVKRKRKSRVPEGIFQASVVDLTHDGRGVARIDGKAVFINGALPEEEVLFKYVKSRSDYDEGIVTEVIKASSDRVEPICKVFGICGGCSLQHLRSEQQIAFKAEQLKSNLRKQAQIELKNELSPLTGDFFHYRNKARLGVKYVPKKGRVLVGFREKFAPFLVEMTHCPVLTGKVSDLILPLSDLIGGLSIPREIPQVEVAVGGEETALSFRILSELNSSDQEMLINFAKQHKLLIYIQPNNEASTYALTENAKAENALSYPLLGRFSLAFKPYHFTQINATINQKMVQQALSLLDIQKDETVLDLFCGLGNFTLALSTSAKKVIGVEGDASLTDWANRNAMRNQVENVEFFCTDLTKNQDDALWMQRKYDAILIDPPRSGALEMVPYLGKLEAKRILYVSCHPATLARDIAALSQYGYQLETAGVMDMFPHTAHVESMALLIKE